MCGISGILTTQAGDRAAITRAVEAMNDRQFRRGPDDAGTATYPLAEGGGTVALGHRRLSIIDLSVAGHQPMERPVGDDLLSITFNGEIYNFRELRAELSARGERFSTETDTEVILALFACEGPASFSKLRGMFAFGIWDSRTQKLYLVRDRYGVKPLYYAMLPGGGIAFASTVEAIRASRAMTFTLDPAARVGFAVFGSVPAPYTTFREVRALQPGFIATLSRGAFRLERCYDPLPFFLRKVSPDRSTAVAEIRRRLEESVRLNLVADAPLGVFLSGGLDSSVLAALAARERGGVPTDTIGVDFEEQEFSERAVRERVVARIRTRHRETTVRAADFSRDIGEVFAAMDQPTIDGVNTYTVSAAARAAGLKAVLSGLGSDEVFLGYHYNRIARRLRLLQRFVPRIAWRLVPRGGKAGRLRWLAGRHPFFAYVAARAINSPADAARFAGVGEDDVWALASAIAATLPPDIERLHPADLFSYLDIRVYMANQLLKDTDVMSMYHSLETRVPFLDHPLVEYVASLPVRMKLAGRPKSLLIDAVRDLLPPEVWERPKMGFTFPFAKWLAPIAGEHEAFRPLMATDGGKDLLLRFKAGNLHWSRLWAAAVAAGWRDAR